MIRKIIELIRENRRNQKEILRYSKELDWANVYHDSIRGKDWIENLSLNIGRWGGNYAFFYVLHRILTDFSPKMILELGLGESTRFISTFLERELPTSSHIVIEQDKDWYDFYLKKNKVPAQTKINLHEVESRIINGYYTRAYKSFEEIVKKKFDLYIVDGPIGTSYFSRYDMVAIAKSLEKEDDFIIIIDDFNRQGERGTVREMLKIFNQKGIKVFEIGFHGLKNIMVLATKKYRFISTF